MKQKVKEWLDIYIHTDKERKFVLEGIEKYGNSKFKDGKTLDDYMPNQLEIRADDKWTPFSSFIRACPCDECEHKTQYECYKADCECCDESCT